MSNDKICVSVCAETAEEMIRQIGAADEFADVIEVRFDRIDPSELRDAFSSLEQSSQIDPGKLLITFRAKEQGGFRELTNEDRRDFWNSGIDLSFWGGDFEEDMIEDSFSRLWDKRVCSFHNFSGVPDDLESIYRRLKTTDADIIKIAVQADGITDSIAVWKLVQKGKADNRQIIAIAMGVNAAAVVDLTDIAAANLDLEFFK